MRSLTLYCSTPINETDVANKAYVDSKGSGDMSFLAKKEFLGDLKTSTVFVGTTGDGATLTASAGKDLYLVKAKISFETEIASDNLTVDLLINGTSGERFRTNSFASGNQKQGAYEYVLTGVKVGPGEIIKIDVLTNSSDTYAIETFIECFEVDTGTDPTL